jgi:L-asparaginase II
MGRPAHHHRCFALPHIAVITTPLPHHVPIAAFFRGGHVENVHHGSMAVVNSEGRLLASAGDVASPLFTRSCLKPLQAMPLIAQAAERYGLSDEDIALLCASHNGEPMHAQRVAALLSKAGASERDLQCGSHTPFFFSANGRTPAPDERFTPLHHNCSGKHSGMLLLARALNAPLAGYLAEDHTVQQEIARSVSYFTGVAVHDLVRGTDGCSAPNFAVPLHALAHAFARLTIAEPDAVYGMAPHRLARAMSRHPEWVSGQGRNDLALMRAGRGDWVSKVGADGVQVLASFSRRIAIAGKCSDGTLTPLMVALVSALEQLGWLDADSRNGLCGLLPLPHKNAAGIEVGEMRPVLALQFED